MWLCAVCRGKVYPDPESGDPASRYWSVADNVVFCSSVCSLKHHQEKQKPDNPLILKEKIK